MSDFEERLRTTVNRRSDDFEPSADLPDRIDARVRHHRRRRQVVTGGLVSVAATVVAVMAAVGFQGRDEEAPIRMTGPDETSTTTTSTTSTSTTTSTTVTTTEAPSGPAVNPLTPLSRHGIGPIAAGMTLRDAQDVARLTITPPSGGGACGLAQIEGLSPSIWLVVEPPTQPGADPMDAVVRAVGGSVSPTAEGAIVGQSRDELVAALGPPTRVENKTLPWDEVAELLVFETDGVAYGAFLTGDMVMGLQSGDPAWIDELNGCPE